MIILPLLCYFFLATAISANKVLLTAMPATLFVGIRMLAAGMLMFTYAYRNSPRLRWNYVKQDMVMLLGASLFTTFVPSLLKAYGLKHLFSSKAALFGSIDPFVTALYAYILWHEKLSWSKFFGMLIGFGGIALMVVTGSPPEESVHAWFVFSFAELASIATVFVSRYGWILIRSLVKSDRYTPLEVNGLSMMGSGALALITAGFFDQWHQVSVASLPQFVLLFAYTIIVGNVLGYTMYAYIIKHANLTYVALTGFTIPIFVALVGWWFLGEPISLTLILAAALVFIGLVIFYYDELKKKYQ